MLPDDVRRVAIRFQFDRLAARTAPTLTASTTRLAAIIKVQTNSPSATNQGRGYPLLICRGDLAGTYGAADKTQRR